MLDCQTDEGMKEEQATITQYNTFLGIHMNQSHKGFLY